MNPQLADLANSEWGINGVILVKDTSAHASDYRRMIAHENTIIASINLDGIDYTAINLGLGCILSGKISSFTLTSGTVAVYK